MVPQKSGLIVALSGYVGVTYTYGVIFGTSKTATDRMARDMAIELKPHNVASLSLWQGFTYTERAQENLKSVPGMASQLNSAVGQLRRVSRPRDRGAGEGSKHHEALGGTFINAELAQEYGVTDIDGRSSRRCANSAARRSGACVALESSRREEHQ